MKLLLNYYLLLIVVATTLVSCENLNVSVINQGTVVGDNVGNSSTSEVDQHAGDRILSPEEIKRAKAGHKRGIEEVIKTQASLGLIDASFDIDWESEITRGEFLDKFPKLDPVHRDLITILHLVYKKVPAFKLFQCARNLKEQRRNMERGVTTTIKGSRHLQRPVQACDLRSARKAKPFVNGKKDIYDVEYLGYFQGLAEGFSLALSGYPCGAFASSVRRVMRWKTIRDLFHIEVNPKKGCEDGYKTEFNKFSLLYNDGPGFVLIYSEFEHTIIASYPMLIGVEDFEFGLLPYLQGPAFLIHRRQVLFEVV